MTTFPSLFWASNHLALARTSRWAAWIEQVRLSLSLFRLCFVFVLSLFGLCVVFILSLFWLCLKDKEMKRVCIWCKVIYGALPLPLDWQLSDMDRYRPRTCPGTQAYYAMTNGEKTHGKKTYKKWIETFLENDVLSNWRLRSLRWNLIIFCWNI